MDTAQVTAKDDVLNAKARVPDHVVYRAFVNETVILNLKSGRYHGVNATGARMLEVLEDSGSVSEAADRLAREFAQPLDELEQDICEFCVELSERGLILLDDAVS
jgi:hypothetical protein